MTKTKEVYHFVIEPYVQIIYFSLQLFTKTEMIKILKHIIDKRILNINCFKFY